MGGLGSQPMTGWVVAVAQWNMEDRARSHLEQQNFSCYFPKFKDVSYSSGRRTEHERHLFGRYFFVKMVDEWRKISGTRGVVDLLCHGENPSVVPDAVIDEIRCREVNGFVDVPQARKNYLFKGQSVRVGHGLLVNHIGIYRGMTRRGREMAALSFFGNVRHVELAAGTLVAA